MQKRSALISMELGKRILPIIGAKAIANTEIVQSLWSNYGEIKRVYLEGGDHSSVIVKQIQFSPDQPHPKGWNTRHSHLRKLKSYQVELEWYRSFSNKTNSQCRVPFSFLTLEEDEEILLVMEDLDSNGYPFRFDPNNVSLDAVKNVLTWLAHFHAMFMGVETDSLWPIGTYWHLNTRLEELEKMKNLPLKQAANAIDKKLKSAQYQTIVHGDAKLANFCFSKSKDVSAVDFQYTGKGCGMKDVAYFISSCFHEADCEIYEKELLAYYFHKLEIALNNQHDFQRIKDEWSLLYPYAWADFYRFLDGWSPGHWKMHGYSLRLTQRVINELGVR